jgi:hypothetical protein
MFLTRFLIPQNKAKLSQISFISEQCFRTSGLGYSAVFKNDNSIGETHEFNYVTGQDAELKIRVGTKTYDYE